MPICRDSNAHDEHSVDTIDHAVDDLQSQVRRRAGKCNALGAISIELERLVQTQCQQQTAGDDAVGRQGDRAQVSRSGNGMVAGDRVLHGRYHRPPR